LITNDYLRGNRSKSWLVILQSFIRFESRVIPSAAAFMYFLSGKMLLIYYKQIILDSTILQSSSVRLRSIDKMLALQVKKFSALDETARQLQRNLGLLNFFNICYIVINSFISAFYIIAFTLNGNIFACALQTTSCIENWVRLYFLCKSSEEIKSSVG